MTDPTPIAVFLSGSGTNLQAILDAPAHGAAYRVARVISDRRQAVGLDRARRAGVPTAVVERGAAASAADFDAALLAAVAPAQAKLIVLAGFMRILGPRFVTPWRGRLLNIHPSLLPKYKGLDTYRRVLDAGDAAHGTSVHFVTDELDGGPVIAQAVVPIARDETEQTLRDKVQAREYALYPRVIEAFCRGEVGLRDDGVTWRGRSMRRPLQLDGSELTT